MLIEVDMFAWIPHPEVVNPIASLPGGVGLWGSGACGPYFGGDDFILPASAPLGPSGMVSRTFRARQQSRFYMVPWGTVSGFSTTGVIPGTTTVLTNTRAASGRVCYSIRATVLRSAASVRFIPSESWYEIIMRGKAQDPVPAATGGRVAGTAGATTASALTPALSWDLTLRFSSGSSLGFWTRAGYSVEAPFSIDESSTLAGSISSLGGGTGNLIHGLITVRRYPSYVVYVSMTTPSGSRFTQVIFFANGISRSPLAEITIPQDSTLRQITF